MSKGVDHDVGFTPEGRAIAEATSARHRFFERLLRDAGVAADEASRDACRLEHCVSADSFEKPLFPLDEESSLRVKRRLSAPGARKPSALLLGRSGCEIRPVFVSLRE